MILCLGTEYCVSVYILVSVFVLSLYVSISVCVSVRPPPLTPVHTKELQEEQDPEHIPCHPTVWSSGLF